VTAITSVQIDQSGAGSITAKLANMSHELRAPLNSVIGLSAVLARQLHGPLTDKQAEYIAQIESSGRHLLALVADILDLAKADADRLHTEIVDVDTAELVAQAVGMIREQARERDIAVLVDVPATLPAARADALRARQMLLNLLSNAVKFTEPGGQVGVSARADGASIALDVWDTGIGIAADQLDLVFEPFEQIDSPLARQHAGTGLGLALTRRLAELQGGSVSAQSIVGRGSVFTISLPAAVVEDADPELEHLAVVVPLRQPRLRKPAGLAPAGARLGLGRCDAELPGGRPVGGRDLDLGRNLRRHGGPAPGRGRVRDAGRGAEPDHRDRALLGVARLVTTGQ
jgi:signal transduction histidine kinase